MMQDWQKNIAKQRSKREKAERLKRERDRLRREKELKVQKEKEKLEAALLKAK